LRVALPKSLNDSYESLDDLAMAWSETYESSCDLGLTPGDSGSMRNGLHLSAGDEGKARDALYKTARVLYKAWAVYPVEKGLAGEVCLGNEPARALLVA
jgi:hypothetical protein